MRAASLIWLGLTLGAVACSDGTSEPTEPPATLAVTVTDAATTAAIPGATVTATGEKGGVVTAIDTNGVYVLGLDPGSFTLTITVAGYVTKTTATITVVKGHQTYATALTATVPSALTVVSGSGQADTVTRLLASPLVVRVTDAAGAPKAGVTVNWRKNGLDPAFGTLSSSSSVTDATGLASVGFTVGTLGGVTVNVIASVAGISSEATFIVNAISTFAPRPSVTSVTGANGAPLNTSAVTSTVIVHTAIETGTAPITGIQLLIGSYVCSTENFTTPGGNGSANGTAFVILGCLTSETGVGGARLMPTGPTTLVVRVSYLKSGATVYALASMNITLIN
jgi:hypothetical protein